MKCFCEFGFSAHEPVEIAEDYAAYNLKVLTGYCRISMTGTGVQDLTGGRSILLD